VRVVVSHLNFAEFAGTETYTLTAAQQLERLGHEVTIYADRTGPMAEFARHQGAVVSDRLSELPKSADAVFAQDAATAYELAARYPTAVRTCTIHSAHNPLQSPPQLEGICHALIVLNDRLRRRAQQLAWRPTVVRLRQPIDLKRFSQPSPPQRRVGPPRVLALGNHTGRGRLELIEAACRTAGLEFVQAGGVGEQTAHPEHAIAGVDIVVSLGRGVLEAMAGGRAAYVLGPGGGDGWVTPESYTAFESDGFSGRATNAVIDGARLTADLADWHDGFGEPGRDLVWAHHDGERHAVELIELVHQLDATPPRSTDHLRELARLVRLEWYSFGRAQAAIAENARIRAVVDELGQRSDELARTNRELADANHQLADANHRLGQANQQLAGANDELTGANDQLMRSRDELEALGRALDARFRAVTDTRRYRLASLLAGPLDRLRARRRG
jgi:hypothetical protein